MAGERRGDQGGEEGEGDGGVSSNSCHESSHLSSQTLHQLSLEDLGLVDQDPAHTGTITPLPQAQLQR